GIVGLVLAVLIFGPLATGAVRTLELLVVQGLTILAMVLWLARFWLNPKYRLFWPPICWLVLLFVGYAIVRHSQADIEYIARKEMIKIFIYAFLFLIVLNNLNRQESTQLVSVAMIFLAMGISLYALYQVATNSEYVWHFIKPPAYKNRGTGTYICPNHLAGFLEMILPLALSYTLAGRFGHATKVFLGYASLVILAGIGVSISRGGWIATGITLSVFFALLLSHRDYRKQAIACLAVLLAAGIVFTKKTEKPQERFQNMFVNGKLEDIRFKLWKPAVEIWKENIWFGAGPAHFDFRFRQYRPEEVQMRGDRVHNDYLNTLTDWGIIGFVLVGSAFVLLGKGLVKTWKFVQRSSNDFAIKKSNKTAFVFGAALGLLAILLHSFVDFNMHIPANAILAISWMALLSGHLRFATEQYWVPSRWPIKLLATAVGLAGIGYLSWQGTRRAEEYIWIERARHLEEYSPEKVAPLKNAFAAAPMNFDTAYQVGDLLRLQAWQGDEGWQDLAKESLTWFDRSMKLNRYDSYSYLRYGMCLDRLGRHQEATPYFKRALELDPNGYYTVAHQGWHSFETGDYAGAKPWFERSLKLKPAENTIATTYLRIINRRLAETPDPK
ncbi:MAG: O-antigen ligase family protein, partial [Verrucomicrobiota bacterium]